MMVGSSFARRIRVIALLLCVYAVCACIFSPVHKVLAFLESGTSGGCTWKYEQVDGNTVLTIAPTEGTEGILGSFSWGGSSHKGTTKRVVVRGTVKVGLSAKEMFKDFGQATSIDVAGLDVTGVRNMQDMFSGCSALESLDLSGWDTSTTVNMKNMFKGTRSLKKITLGNKFHIKANAKFEDAGLNVGVHWVRKTDGTAANSGDTIFYDVNNLIVSHNQESGTGPKHYVRQAASKGKSGTCAWEYIPLKDQQGNPIKDDEGKNTYKLSIRPQDGHNSGTLEDWGDENRGVGVPPWRLPSCDEYRKQTTELEIKEGGEENKQPVKAARSCYNMFAHFTKLKKTDISGLDVSSTENMQGVFYMCSSLESVDVSKWNTSSMKNATGVFHKCSALTTIIGLDNWDTSQVTSISYIFCGCFSLTSLDDISNWDVSNVKLMTATFSNCPALTSLDLSKWRTPKVTSMYVTFYSCSSLESLDLSGWDTLNVTTMQEMFQGCKALSSLNLSGWNTGSVSVSADMKDMFTETYALKDITLGNNFKFKGDSVETGFQDAGSWVDGHWTQIGTGTVDAPEKTFGTAAELITSHSSKSGAGSERYIRQAITKGVSGGCMWEYIPLKDQQENPIKDADGDTYKLSIHPLPDKNSGTLENWGEWDVVPWSQPASHPYRAQTTLIEIKKNGETKPVKARTCRGMFYDFQKVKTADILGLDTSEVKDMSFMFKNCHALTSVNNECDVSKVKQMKKLFCRCYALTTPNVNGWNVSSVANMQSLFHCCYALKSLDLSRWQVGAVTNMKHMFDNCPVLTGIGDVSRWNTPKVTNMSLMFWGCYTLTSLNLGGWDTSQVTEMANMFKGTHSLKKIILGNKFKFKGDSVKTGFQDAGLWAGNRWAQVGTGTVDVPEKTFDTADTAAELIRFHNNKSGTGSEHYIRQAITKGISGGCMWEYIPLKDSQGIPIKDAHGKDTYKLSIHPLPKKDGNGFEDSGTLENWGDWRQVPWSQRVSDPYRKQTTQIEIKKNGETQPVKARTCQGMFYNFQKVTTADILGLDTSEVEDMSYMFENCHALTSVNNKLDVSKVEIMQSLFHCCHALGSLDLSGWQVDAVTNMESMFDNCSVLTGIGDVSGWNTSKVTNMSLMFWGCYTLTSLNLGGWKTPKATTMARMFQGCKALTSLNLGGWNTSGKRTTDSGSVSVNMKDMFTETYALKDITLGNGFKFIDPPAGTTGFQDAGSWVGSHWLRVRIDEVDVPEDTTPRTSEKLVNYHNEIGDQRSRRYVRQAITKGVSGGCMWEYIPLKDQQGNLIKDADGKDTYKLSIHPLPGENSGTLENWGSNGEDYPPWGRVLCKKYRKQTTKLEIKEGEGENKQPVKALTCANMFAYFKNLKDADVLGLDTSESISLAWMFYECMSLPSLNVSKFTTEKVYSTFKTFYRCESLKKIEGLTEWNTENVTRLGGTFARCKSLTSLDLTKWQPIPQAEHYFMAIRNMFWGCENLATLKGISKWNVENVVDMDSVFCDCYALKSLDLSGWDTSKVTTTRRMFRGCKALTSLNLSGWNTSGKRTLGSVSVSVDMEDMFKGTYFLKDITLGDKFKFIDPPERTTGFQDAGSWVGSHWLRVRIDEVDVPEDITLRTPEELVNYHNEIGDQGSRRYVLRAVTKGVSGGCMWEYIPLKDQQGNLIKDADGKDTYKLSIHPLPGESSGTLENWGEGVPPWRLSPCDEYRKQTTELEIKKGEGDNKKPVEALTCRNMFADFQKLQKADVSGLGVSGETNMQDMFRGTHSLKDITLGVPFHIEDNAKFEDAGSNVGTHWVQVGDGNNVKDPKGRVFGTPDGLRKFHSEKTGSGSERYVRHAVTKGESGGCMWEYVPLKNQQGNPIKDAEGKDTYKLSIHPLPKKDGNGFENSGTLEDWGEGVPPWRLSPCDEYRKQTTELEIKEGEGDNKKPVKAPTCRNMFADFQKLKKADISGLDVSGVTNMQDMFRGTYFLKDITLGNNFQIEHNAKFGDAGYWIGSHWLRVGTGTADVPEDTTLRTPEKLMEYHNGKNGQEGSEHYVLRAVTRGMSGGCMWEYIPLKDQQGNPIKDADGKDTYKLSIHPLPGKNSGTLDNWKDWWHVPWSQSLSAPYRKQTTKIEIKKNGETKPVKAQTCQGMFEAFWSVVDVDISGLDTKGVTDISFMFRYCHVLKTVNLNELNVSSVTTMSGLFSECHALTKPYVGEWKELKVTNMSYLFHGCSSLESLDLSGWKTSKVTTMRRMFRGCEALTSLNLSGWNTSGERTTDSGSVSADMSGMFQGTYFLKDITLGDKFKFIDPPEGTTGFQDAGSWVGSHWLRVRIDEVDVPEDTTPRTSEKLVNYHNEIGDQRSRRYVRQAITKGVSGGCMWEYIPLKDQQGNLIKDADNKDTYKLSIHPLPGESSGTLENWGEGVPPWRLSPCDEYRKQTTELEIKKGEGENKQPVEALTCRNMFADFQKLQKADVSGLGVSGETNMQDMFRGTHSLKDITLGVPFHIKDDTNNDAKFEDAGSNVGSYWVRVADGTVENPKGQVFASAKELIGFHQKRTKEQTDTERYIRVSEYIINFHKNAPAAVEPGAIEGTMDPQKIKYGDEVPLNENKFVFAGHTFRGWCTSKNGSGGRSFADKAMVKDLAVGLPDGKVELYAQWATNMVDEYTVYFHANVPDNVASTDSSGEMDPQKIKYGDEVPLNENKFVFAGHTFRGWCTSKNGSGGRSFADKAMVKDLAVGLPDGKVELYAQWATNMVDEYTVYFHANVPDNVASTDSSGEMDPQKIKYGDEVPLNENKFVFAGHTFRGWCTSKNGSGGRSFADKAMVKDLAVGLPDGKVELYAQWATNMVDEYTVYFHANVPDNVASTDSSGEMDPQKIKYGDEVPLNENKFVFAGHTFRGWCTSKNGSGGRSFADKAMVKDLAVGLPDGKVELYAQWATNMVDEYTVYFHANVPDNVASTDSSGEMDPQKIKYGDEVPLNENKFVFAGHAFRGWCTSKNGSGGRSFADKAMVKDLAVGLPDGKVELYAQWAANMVDEYTVYFHANVPDNVASTDSSGEMDPQKIKYGDEVPLNENKFVFAGHAFRGWCTSKNGSGGRSFADKAMVKDLAVGLPDGKVELYAQWATNMVDEYTVYFHANVPDNVASTDSSGEMDPQKIKYGDEVPLNENKFVFAGHAFRGWCTSKNGSGGRSFADKAMVKDLAVGLPDGKVELYAQWATNMVDEYTVYFHANVPDNVASTDSSGEMDPQKIKYGDEVPLNENKFVFAGHAFRGWCTSKNGSGGRSFADKAMVKDLAVGLPDGKVELYAQWATNMVDEYTVYFHANVPDYVASTDSSGEMDPQKIKYGDEVPLNENKFVFAGHTFRGWCTSKNGSGGRSFADKAMVKDLAVGLPDGKVELYAQWATNMVDEYTVYFHANVPDNVASTDSSGEMDPQKIKYGDEVPLNENKFVFAGHTFRGWCTSKNGSGGRSFADKAMVKDLAVGLPDGKVELYAQWATNMVDEYTVYFHANVPDNVASTDSSGEMDPQKIKYGDEVPLNENKFVFAGHTFRGWCTSKNGSGGRSFADKAMVKDLVVGLPDGKVELYAQWATNMVDEYTVYFHANVPDNVASTDSSGEMDPQKIKYGDEVPLNENKFVFAGHAFRGWCTSKNGSGGRSFADKAMVKDLAVGLPDGKVELYAQWATNMVDEYTVYFHANVPDNVASTDSSGEMDPQKIKYGDEVPLNENKFVFAGHTFRGWCTSKNGSGGRSFADKAMVKDLAVGLPDGKVELYAQWATNMVDEYTVYFHANVPDNVASTDSSGEMDPQKIKYGDEVPLNENKFVFAGHAFRGWCTSKNGSGGRSFADKAMVKDLAVGLPDGKVELYAQWATNMVDEYTVYFHANVPDNVASTDSSGEMDPQKIKYGDEVPLNENKFVFAGHAFRGWCTSKNGSGGRSFADKAMVKDLAVGLPDGKVELYAQWATNMVDEYTVYFHANVPDNVASTDSSGEMDPQKIKYGDEVPLNENKFVFAGHAFRGWCTSKNGSGGRSFADKAMVKDLAVGLPDGKVELYAQWATNMVDEYTVYFHANVPDNVASTDSSGEMDPQKIKYGDEVPLNENKFVFAGHTFRGWCTSKNGSGGRSFADKAMVKDLAVGLPDGKVELYAQWATNMVDEYTVYFHANVPDNVASTDSSGEMDPQKIKYGDEVPLNENKFVFAGHAFRGWCTSKNGSGGRSFADKAMVKDLAVGLPDGKVELYAQWAANMVDEYTVYFHANVPDNVASTDSSGEMDPQKIKYGDEVPLNENKFVFAGHTFRGWCTSKNGSGGRSFADKAMVKDLAVGLPDGKVELYAQWATNMVDEYTVYFHANVPDNVASTDSSGEMDPQKIKYGDEVPLNENKFVFAGHAFRGWCTSKNGSGGRSFADKAMVKDLAVGLPDGKVELYAQWATNMVDEYTVYFHANVPDNVASTDSSGEMDPQKIKYGDEVPLNENKFVFAGHAFRGWCTSKNGSGGRSFADKAMVKDLAVGLPDGKVELYAQWATNMVDEYTVYFHANVPDNVASTDSSGEMDPQKIKYGDEVPLNENKFVFAGHAFRGWCTSKNGSGGRSFADKAMVKDLAVGLPDGKVELYAQWATNMVDEYTVYFHANVPDNVASTDSSGEMDPQKIKYGDEVPLNENKFVFAGHAFRGWCTSKNGSGGRSFADKAMVKDLAVGLPDGKVELYAQWATNMVDEYTVYFHANVPDNVASTDSSGEMDPQKIKYGDEVPLNENKFVFAGHAFRGWCTSKNGSGGRSFADKAMVKDLAVGLPDGKVELYAQWATNMVDEYTVYFHANVPDNVASTDSSGEMDPQKIKYGDEVPLNENKFVFAGHTFRGWCTSKNGSGGRSFADKAMVKDLAVGLPDGKVELYAQWATNMVDEYTVYFHANVPDNVASTDSSGEMDPQKIKYGDEVPLNENKFVFAGHAFRGWCTSKNGSGGRSFADKAMVKDLAVGLPDGKVELYAQWATNMVDEYTVYFHANVPDNVASTDSSGEMDPQKIKYGDEVPLNENKFVFAGHTFRGWCTSKNGSGGRSFADKAMVKDLAVGLPDGKVELYAQWATNMVDEYTVYFHANVPDNVASTDSSGEMDPQKIKYGDEVPLNENKFVFAGHTFRGWCTSKNGSGGRSFADKAMVKDLAVGLPDGKVELYAQWATNMVDEYTVYFHANVPDNVASTDSSGEMDPQKIKYGDEVPLNENKFVFAGHAFRGWCTSKNGSGGRSFADKAMVKDLAVGLPDGKVELYAQWATNMVDEYTVYFHANVPDNVASTDSSGEMDPQKIKYGDEVPLNENKFVFAGHAFRGWCTSKNGSGGRSFADKAMVKDLAVGLPDGKVELYAQWATNMVDEYTVYFHANVPDNVASTDSSGEMDPQKIKYGDEVPLNENKFVFAGHTFRGWCTSKNGSGGRSFADKAMVKDLAVGLPDGKVELYAQWATNMVDEYTVYFHANVPDNVASTDSSGEMDPQKIKYGDEVPLNENKFVFAGHTFRGWCTSKNGSGGRSFADKAMVKDLAVGLPDGKVELYAQWATNMVDEYTVYFHANVPDNVASTDSSGEMDPQKIKYGDEVPLNENKFVFAGHTFRGWCTSKNGSGGRSFADKAMVKDLAVGLPDGKVELYAQWATNMVDEYTVYFHANVPDNVASTDSSGEMDPQKIKYGDEVPLNENKFVFAGHTFRGWCTSKNGSGGRSFADKAMVKDLAVGLPDGKVELYAQWATNMVDEYTVYFHANVPDNVASTDSSGEMDPQKIKYGDEVPLNENKFVFAGHTFRGWCTSKNGSGGRSFADKAMVKDLASGLPTKEVNLYAQWGKHGETYTVIFNKNAPEGVDPEAVKGDMENQEMTYGEAKALNGNKFTLAGHSFLGWSTQPGKPEAGKLLEDKAIVKDLASGLPTKEVNLYAQWGKHGETYTVIFNKNAPEGVDPEAVKGDMENQEMTYGEAKALNENKFTLEGHSFLGWSTQPGKPEAGKLLEDKAMVKDLASGLPTKEVNLYAQWGKHGETYTLIFNKNAPEGVDPEAVKGNMQNQEMTYGEAKALNENKFTLEGHSFLGWSTQPGKPEAGKLLEDKAMVKDLASGLPTKEVNLYAQWGKHGETYTVIFNKNAPEGVDPEAVKGNMQNQEMTYGEAKALNENKFTLAGHSFLGWSTKPGKPEAGKLLEDKAMVKDLATNLPTKEVNLYAQWGKHGETYTVIFNKNAPEGVDPAAVKGDMENQEMTYGEAKALNENKFTLEGHSFLGWSTQPGKPEAGKLLEDKAMVKDLASGLPTKEVNLYAQWGKHGETYTLIFNKNAPEGVDPEAVKGNMQNQEMTYGEAKALNENTFTLDGYSFLGWSTQPGKPEAGKFLEDKAIVKDLATGLPTKEVNLYAQWGKHGETYTVIFNKNAPEGVDPEAVKGNMQNQEMTYGEAKALNENKFTLAGHSFLGWSTKPGKPEAGKLLEDKAMVKDLATNLPTKEVNLYAQWGKHGETYTVIFNKNAPEGVDPAAVKGDMENQEMTYGEAKALNENKFTLEGHSFLGWSTQPGKPEAGKLLEDKAMVKDLASGLPTKEVNLYAQWGKHGETYTVIFNKNAPEGVDPEAVKGNMQNQEMTYGEAAALNENTFTLDGYSFLGWSTQPGKPEAGKFLEDKAIVKDLATGLPTKEVNLYAQWGKHGETYTVIFNKNAPEGVDPEAVKGNMQNQEMTYGEAKALNENKFTLAGHSFLGWSTKPGKPEAGKLLEDKAMVKDLATNLPTKEVNLYAQWGKHGETYTVIFNKNAPEGVDPAAVKGDMENQEMTYGEAKALNENKFTLEGHSFLGWSTQPGKPEAGKLLEDKAMVKDLASGLPTKEVNLYAQWGKHGETYTVIFNKNAPEGVDPEAVKGNMQNQEMTYGEAAALNENTFTLDGYSFLGWSTQPGKPEAGKFLEDKAIVKDLATGLPTKEVNLYAQWSEALRITYEATEGGSVSPTSEMLEEGVDPQGSTAIPDEGYHFVKWTSDKKPDWSFAKAVLGKEEIEAVAKEDGKFSSVTFTAHFEADALSREDTYTVTFDKNDIDAEGTMSDETFTCNVAKKLPACTFTKEGYKFSGWNTEADGSGTSFEDEAEMNLSTTMSIILYAQWENAVTGEVKEPMPTDQLPELRSDPRQEPSHPSGWYQDDNRVFYYRNRRKLTGWHELEGTIQKPWSLKKNWFYFDKKGIMLTGRHKLVGGFKNAQGVQKEHWFGLDEKTGAQIRGWQKAGNGSSEKWYYYRPEDGTGLVGRHQIVGGFKNAHGVRELNWFYFNKVTGAQIRGWHKITEDGTENWYYYRDGDGIMLKGRHRLVGGFKNAQGVQEMNWFYFDRVTGIEVRGWHKIIEGGFENWYYYRDSDGIMLKGQHRLTGGFKNQQGSHEMNWFYFDDITGVELRNCWKDISSQNKTCYYGSDGAMYKGWRVIDGRWYYFDDATGARH